MDTFIGIDVGTSACRACAIDERGNVIAETRSDLPAPLSKNNHREQQPEIWWQHLLDAVDRLNRELEPASVSRLAIDGTSATLLLCDRNGKPLTTGLMYNDARAVAEAEQIGRSAPTESAVAGPSSSLAKLLYLQNTISETHYLALHQADWLSGRMSGRFGTSDENNALKMGYDPLARRWPDWLNELEIPADCLPEVRPPGSLIGAVEPTLTTRWGWPDSAQVVTGTTDSTAGFIATGASTIGTAVTALGSTLVLKVLSDKPVFAPEYGVYSHRLGDVWLVGGASNAGGTVLRQLFSACDIRRFTRLMQPEHPTGLDYYPLPAAGERFPIQDPALQPRLTPRPSSDAVFFQAILESLARIEQRGYRLLAELGAPYPGRVLTVGGGAQNEGWTRIRQNMLGVPVTKAGHQEAAYGAALLARGDSRQPRGGHPS